MTSDEIAIQQLIATWAGVGATAILSILTLVVLMRQIGLQSVQKQVDIGLMFNKEYLTLWQTPFSSSPTSGTLSTDEWLVRFWQLQMNQFIFWNKAFLDHDIFKMWMARRVLGFHEGLREKGISKEKFIESYGAEKVKDQGALESKRFFVVYDKFLEIAKKYDREKAQRSCISYLDTIKPRFVWY